VKTFLLSICIAFGLFSENAFAQKDRPRTRSNRKAWDPNAPSGLVPVKPMSRESKSSNSRTFSDESKPSGTGLNLSLGLLGGYSASTPKNAAIESEFSGYHLGAHTLLEISYSWFSLNMGGGYFINAMQGKFAQFENEEGTESTRLDRLTIRTKAGFGAVIAHAALGNFRMGPVVHIPFGTPSIFSPAPVDTNRTAVFAGASFAWIFRTSSILLGVQALADLNIKERLVSFALLDLRYIIPIIVPHTEVTVKTTFKLTEKTEIKKVNQIVERVVTREKVRFAFSNKVINFETGKADLFPQSAALLRKIGSFLSSRPELWASLEIEGHTDNRGTRDYNIALSQARALSVLEEMAKAGTPNARMQARGYGFDKPVDPGNTPAAWEKNRRVEIAFVGVKNSQELKAFFDSLEKGTSN